MTIQKAGTKVPYTITWLEMNARPEFNWPHLPLGSTASLLKAVKPPVWYFLSLYGAVGRDYAWEDKFELPEEKHLERLSRSQIYTLIDDGFPHGFFMLEDQSNGVCDLAYFGLVPEAVGKGLGTFLLRTAILTAWEKPEVRSLTLNTCTLDHPRALALYQKNGFTAVGREDRVRTLARDRDLTKIPS